MIKKSELSGVIEAHAENIRLVNILRVLARKNDLLKNFHDVIGEEATRNPGFTKSLELLENTDKLIHTTEQLHLMAVRSAVSECYELTHDYCKKTNNYQNLQNQPWFHVIRILRNAVNHNFFIEFCKFDKTLLPLKWGKIYMDISMDNIELSHKIFLVSAALEWLEALETFINDELV